MRTSWSTISTQVFSSDFRQETNNDRFKCNQKNHRFKYNQKNHRFKYNQKNHRFKYNQNNDRFKYNQNNDRFKCNQNNDRFKCNEDSGTTANDIEGVDQDMVENEDVSIVSRIEDLSKNGDVSKNEDVSIVPKIVQRIVSVCENEGDFGMYQWTDSMAGLNVATNEQMSQVSIVSMATSSNEIRGQEMVTKEVDTSRTSASRPQNIPESSPQNVPESSPQNVPESSPQNVPESVSQSRDSRKVKQEESLIELVTIDD